MNQSSGFLDLSEDDPQISKQQNIIGQQSANDENVRLRQKNIKLEEEIKSIRSQFDDAIKVTNEMDLLFRKNNELSKSNRDLQAELDDMKRRLDISFHLNDELQAKVEQDKLAVKSMISNESQAYQKNFNDFQQMAEKKMQSMKNEIEQLKKQNKQITEDNNKINFEISNTLRIADIKFQSTFDSLSIFNNFLKNFDVYKNRQKTELSSKQDVSNDGREKQIDLNKLSNKYSKLKSKYQRSMNAKKSIENENASLAQKLERQKEEYESSVKSISNEINEIHRQQKLKDAQNQQEKERLQSNIEKLQTKIDKLQAKKDENQSIPISEQQKSQAAQQNANDEEDNNELKEKVEALSEHIKKIYKSNEKYKKQISSLVLQIEEMDEEKAKLEEKIKGNKMKSQENANSLKLKIDDLSKTNLDNLDKIKKLESQNDAIYQSLNQSKATVTSLQNKVALANSSVASFEGLLKKQNNEISMLSQIKEVQSSVVQKQIALFSVYEAHIKKLLDKIKILNQALENEQNIKKDQQIIDTLPESCWICLDLPKELCDALAEIGRITIQPADQRLRQALSVVAIFIQEKYGQWLKQESDLNKKYSHMSEILKQLLLIVNIQIGEPAVDFDALLKNPSLIDEISTRFDSATTCEHDNNFEKKDYNDSSALQNLLDIIGSTDPQKAENEIENMRKLLDDQNDEIKRMSAKNKHLKTVVHQFANDLDIKQQEIKSAISKGKKDVDNIQAQLDNKIDECNNLNDKISQLQRNIENIEEQFKEDLETSKTEQLDMTKNICQKMKNDYDLQLKRRDQDIIKAQKAAEKIQQSLSKAKARNDQLRSQLNERIEEIQKLEDDIAQAKKMQKAHYEIQLKNVTDQFYEAIDLLKKESLEKDEEIQKNKKLLRDSNAKYDQLSESKNSLTTEKQQLSIFLDAQKQELEREKRLSATKLKAITLSSEMKIQNEVESIRMNCEQQKREIFHFAAEVFKQFFDPRMQMTESCYKTILQNVKSKLDASVHQEESIRKLLGIVGNENIESVLMQVLPTKEEKTSFKVRPTTAMF